MERPGPIFCTIEALSLMGTMVVYDSHAEMSRGIPEQWRAFRAAHPELGSGAKLCGASPCTADGKIHYLTGIEQEGAGGWTAGEQLRLEAGEYAVVRVEDAASLRDTWVWMLTSWLPTSGRKEKHAPEFERYTGISDAGTPAGPVEIWIPLEPAGN